MPVPNPLRPRLGHLGRALLWTAMGLLLLAGLAVNPFSTERGEAWAAVTACPDNSTIPITPLVLFLKYGGPPKTYGVSLCETPDAPVTITITDTPAGRVTVSPNLLVLTDTVTETVSVGVVSNHPVDQPFTVVITHSASSADPDFDHGTANMPEVRAYYSPPVAVDDDATALHGQSIAIDVLANDEDRAGQGIFLPPMVFTTSPMHGTAWRNANQTLQYTPDVGFAGFDSFGYRVEDTIGNTDIGTVRVLVAEAGTTNPQVLPVDPDEETVLEFESSFGAVTVTVPPLKDIPAGAEVVFTFAEVITPTGDLDDPSAPVGRFSGITFRIEGFVNGAPLDSDNLTGPVTIQIELPAGFVDGLDGARILVAVWDGTQWIVEGITGERLSETLAAGLPAAVDATLLTFNTTVFGEFAIFTYHAIYLPLVDAE